MKTLLYLVGFEVLFVLLIATILWLWVLLVPPFVIPVKRLHVKGALGLALPGFIFLTPGAWDERVLRHELAHIRQMRRYSPLGVAALLGWHYGAGVVRHVLRVGGLPSFWSLWERNPLEQEANREMDSDEPLPKLVIWRKDPPEWKRDD